MLLWYKLYWFIIIHLNLYCKVRLEDRGVYVCFANNSAGEESVRVTLEITAPLSAHVQPQAQIVDVGKDASFQCVISGYPMSQIIWLHNGNIYWIVLFLKKRHLKTKKMKIVFYFLQESLSPKIIEWKLWLNPHV